ncbi:hypothetical protein RMATCC62417_14075 [Rhizopus microsporus]|nr:hypothetical protein RMATCC62417_14075 [Rhizopus microsporus]
MLTVAVKDKIHRLIRVILPFLKSRAGVLSISSAAILAVLYSLVQKFNRPPSQLRHLPYVDRFTFLKYGFKDIPYDQYGKEKLLPLLKAGTNGIYLRCTIEGWSVRLANPIAIKQFTLKQEYTFPKATDNGGVEGSLIKKFLGGPNIVFLSGADWKRHRKIANLAFQRSMPIKLFGKLTKKMFESMEDLGYDNVDVNDLFQRFTLDAIGIGGFGFDFNALSDKDSQWVRNYESIVQGMASPFFIAFPAFDTTYRHWFKKRLEVHNNLDMFLDNIDKMIEQKRKNVYENAETSSSDEEKDLLTLMIESETKGAGERMSDEELRSNLCIFFLAGHDTTANTLAAILYELAKHPEIQERARQEAIRILGDGPEDIVPTFDQLKELSYINMIIKEVSLLNPFFLFVHSFHSLLDLASTSPGLCNHRQSYSRRPHAWRHAYSQRIGIGH